MSWNYRVIAGRKETHSTGEVYTPYGIHEVYYSDEGVPTHMSSASVDLTYWSEDEETDSDVVKKMRLDLGYMLEALDKPILSHELFI